MTVRKKQFDVQLWGIRFVQFLWKDGKSAWPMREDMDGKIVFFSTRVGIQTDVVIYKVSFPLSTLIWRVKIVSRHEKRIIERSANTPE